MKFLFIIFLVGWIYCEQNATHPIRDFFTSSQLGSSADVGLGTAFDGVFVKVIEWLPRLSLWSVTEGKPKINLATPLKLKVESIKVDPIVDLLNIAINSTSPNGTELMEAVESSDYIKDLQRMDNVIVSNPAVTLEDASCSPLLYVLFNFSHMDDCFTFKAGDLADVTMVSWTFDAVAESMSVLGSTMLRNDDIPDFYQGVLLTCLYAVVPMIISLLWCCFASCAHCYCWIRCCFFRRRKVEQTIRMTFPYYYCPRFYIYKVGQCCCRCHILCFSLFIFILMMIWALFAFQSHVGVSNSINRTNDDYDTVEDHGNSVAGIPNSVQRAVDNLGERLNSTLGQLLDIVPIGDGMAPHIQCMEYVKKTLPSIEALKNFTRGIEETLANLGDLFKFDSMTDNLTKSVDELTKEAIPPLIATLKNMSVDLSDLQENVDYLTSVLEDAKNYYPNGTDDTLEVATVLFSMLALADSEWSPSNIQALIDDLDTPGGRTGALISADFIARLLVPLTALDTLANFTRVNNTMQYIVENTYKIDWDNVSLAVENLNNGLFVTDESSQRLEAELAILDQKLNNFSYYVDNELKNLVVEFNDSIIAAFPDFGPIYHELGKLNTSFAVAEGCISNITDIIDYLNRTIFIFPESVTSIINTMKNLTGFFADKVDVDAQLGPIEDMRADLDGTIQNVTADVLYYNSTVIRAMLPDVHQIDKDIDAYSKNLTQNANQLNMTFLRLLVNESRNGFSNLLFFDIKYDVQETLVWTGQTIANNETIANATGVWASAGIACTTDCPSDENLMSIKDDLIKLNHSLFAYPNISIQAYQFAAFLAVREAIPDADEILPDLNAINATLGEAVNVSELVDEFFAANNTLENDLPFNKFSDMTDDFLDSISEFNVSDITASLDSLSDAYDQFDASALFGPIENMTEMLMDFIESIPNTLNNLTGTLVPLVNDTLGDISGLLASVREEKDGVLDTYIFPFDGYRLLLFLFVIIALIPIPSLGCFACCCTDDCLCEPCDLCLGKPHERCTNFLWCCSTGQCSIRSFCLLCWGGCFLCFGIWLLWLFPLLGVPFAILSNDLCDNTVPYLQDTSDLIANNIGNINISRLVDNMLGETFDNLSSILNEREAEDVLKNGLSPRYLADVADVMVDSLFSMINGTLDGFLNPNMTENFTLGEDFRFAFTFKNVVLKQVLESYLTRDEEEKCKEELLDTLKIVATDGLNDLGDYLAGILPLFILPGGFRFNPNVTDIMTNITHPEIGNLTEVLDETKPIIGCERLNALVDIVDNAICFQGRRSIEYFWGIVLLLALILQLTSCCSVCTYCALEHLYTSSNADKRAASYAHKYEPLYDADDDELLRDDVDDEGSDGDDDFVGSPAFTDKPDVKGGKSGETAPLKGGGGDTELEDMQDMGGDDEGGKGDGLLQKSDEDELDFDW